MLQTSRTPPRRPSVARSANFNLPTRPARLVHLRDSSASMGTDISRVAQDRGSGSQPSSHTSNGSESCQELPRASRYCETKKFLSVGHGRTVGGRMQVYDSSAGIQ